ncbi:MAG TPA: MFS transporter [Anaerolineaceae bacterium]|nr:MFS transporter [Anaerolineaceae bacterium]HPN51690.1 MFS transporter [Anaerolineaceae bacterium]
MDSIEEDFEFSISEKLNPTLEQDEPFHTSEIITIAAAHGAHDTYFSYLPTLLPLLIENLSLNTTQAGLLNAFNQIPNLLQPFIGYLADRKNLKYLVILAPTLSGILISLLGIAPTFGFASFLMLLAGFSTAGFHAIAPAMISARSGKKVGKGMSFFMVGGELGFGIGPLVVVATIGALGLAGLPWLMLLGMLASAILYFRLKDISTVHHAQKVSNVTVKEALLEMRSIMLPIAAIIFITGFLNANIINYLPTFMTKEGVAFSIAGASLAIVELGGTLGVFVMGQFSDRFGQRNVALLGISGSILFAFGFLMLNGFLQLLMLVGVGLTAFLANPAFLSITQTRFSKNRSLANGVYMSTSFILRSIVVVIVGAASDVFGMRPVFMGSIFLAIMAIPFIFLLPRK